MNYTIITPQENNQNGYKDAGILGFYRWQDIQCLAELYGQEYASLASSCKNAALGGDDQWPAYSTLWIYFGYPTWGLPNNLHPDQKWLEYERLKGLVEENTDDFVASFPLLTDSHFTLPTWLWKHDDPLSGLISGAVRDDTLVNLYNDGFVSSWFTPAPDAYVPSDLLSVSDFKRPFIPHKWTDPKDIISAYSDAKEFSYWDQRIMSRNSYNSFYSGSCLADRDSAGQAFDRGWAAANNHVMTHRIEQNGPSPYYDQTTDRLGFNSGWTDSAFSHRVQYWNRQASNSYYDGSQDGYEYYHYRWISQVDTLSCNIQDAQLEKNMPIPTEEFGLSCMFDHVVVFVWKVSRQYRKWWGNASGQDVNLQWTEYYYTMRRMTKAGQAQFTDIPTNTRRYLCQKYTLPYSEMEVMINDVINASGWAVPPFDTNVYRWRNGSTGIPYVDDELDQIDVEPYGAFSVQLSKLTERLQKP